MDASFIYASYAKKVLTPPTLYKKLQQETKNDVSMGSMAFPVFLVILR